MAAAAPPQELPLEHVCTDLALESLRDAFALLDESAWNSLPVSHSSSRTVHLEHQEAAGGGPLSGRTAPRVPSSRASGRVKGASVSTLRALLLDSDFREYWIGRSHEIRDIIPGKLCVMQEVRPSARRHALWRSRNTYHVMTSSRDAWHAWQMLFSNLLDIPQCEFFLIRTHARIPNAGWLLIERSVEHSSLPCTKDAVRSTSLARRLERPLASAATAVVL